MGIIGILWLLFIVLKILGVAFVATSWMLVLFWPLLPALIIWLIAMLLGVTVGVFGFRKKTY